MGMECIFVLPIFQRGLAVFPGSHAQELNGTHFLHVVSSTGILEFRNFHKIEKVTQLFSCKQIVPQTILSGQSGGSDETS